MKKQLHLIRGELIGLEVEVVGSKNPSLKGKRGTITDETKNMLTIEKDGTISKLIKEQVVLKIGDQEIPGAALCSRPEERIKLSSKKINKITRSVKKNGKDKNKEPGK